MSGSGRTDSGRPVVLGLGVCIAVVVAGSGYLWSQSLREHPEPSWPSLSLHVPELGCAAWCSVKVSSATDGMDGVCTERLDAQSNILTVRFDPLRTSPDAIVRGLRERGFRVAPGAPDDANDTRR